MASLCSQFLNIFLGTLFLSLFLLEFNLIKADELDFDNFDNGDIVEDEASDLEFRPFNYSNFSSSTIGLRSGFAYTDLSNYDESLEYGVEYGYQPYIHYNYSYAIELSGYVSNGKRNLPTLTRTKLLGKGIYNFSGTTPLIHHGYIGAGIGPIWDKLDNKTSMEVGLVPTIGFDIPLNQRRSGFTLGADANFAFVSGDKPETFALNGVLKYKFR